MQLAADVTKRLLLSYSFPWLWIAASCRSAAAGSQHHQPKDLYHVCVSKFVLGFADGWPEGPHLLPGTKSVQEKKRKDCTFRRQIDKKPSTLPGCLGMSLQCRLCTGSPSMCAKDPTKHHSQAKDRPGPRPSPVLSNNAGCKQTLCADCCDCCDCTLYASHNLKHLPNVETRFYCP